MRAAAGKARAAYPRRPEFAAAALLWSPAMEAAPTRIEKPLYRLLAYMRLTPGGYVLGGVLTLLYAAFFLLVPLVIRDIVDALENARGEVGRSILWLVLVSLSLALARLFSRIVMFNIGREIEFRIRNDYFAHLQSLPQSFYLAHRTGDLMSRAVNDINSIRMFLGMGFLNLLQTPVLFAGALVVLLPVDPVLTLVALAPFPLFVLITRHYSRYMFQANLAGQEQLGKVSTVVQENASGALVVKAYDLPDLERERFEDQNQELFRRMMKVGVMQTTMFAGVGLVPSLSAALVLWLGGQRVQAGLLGSEDLWLFWILIGMLTFPTMMLGFVVSITQRGLAALERLGAVLDIVPSIRDREDTADVSRIAGRVEFRNLTFTYPGSYVPALKGIDLVVEAGATVGIVGPVGSGKTTLVNLVPRLLEVDDGSILIDDVDLNRLPVHLLRSSIAMVPQDSFLFSISVAENIRYGVPDADIEEVRRAAARAQVEREIDEFEDGFDTVVGERGVTLSGGQRQRVALARAMILRPSILILDDSLSSVDHGTEEAILGDLEGRRRGRTCFIVAHRISAVRHADQIVVLENGRITERGTHRELVKLDGFYARLHRRQELLSELEVGDGDVGEVVPVGDSATLHAALPRQAERPRRAPVPPSPLKEPA